MLKMMMEVVMIVWMMIIMIRMIVVMSIGLIINDDSAKYNCNGDDDYRDKLVLNDTFL